MLFPERWCDIDRLHEIALVINSLNLKNPLSGRLYWEVDYVSEDPNSSE